MEANTGHGMRTIGSVAAALVLRLLLDEAKKSRPVMTPDGVAGAAKDCGADTQGGDIDGCEVKASLRPEDATARFGESHASAVPRPSRGIRI